MTKIQHRRDNATNWASVNPVLGQGELAYNTTDGSFRIGDGINYWSALAEYQYGAIHYMGVWDASGGSYPTNPEQGQYYVISVAGTISGTVFGVDDWIVYNGLAWNKINNKIYADVAHEHSDKYQPLDADLTSIAGLTGTTGLLKKTAANTWTLDTSAYSLTSHNHSGVYEPVISTKNTAFNVNFGTTSGTACQGNDSRLSDSRTPTSHTHGNITNAGAIGSTANLAVITTTSGVLTTGTVPVASGGTGSTTAAGALTNLGLTATAAELNKMDGVTATTAEINYIDGVTSNIQTQLNAKEPVFSKNTAFNKNFGTASGTVCQGNDSRLSDSRAPTSHTHGNITNAGAIGSTANLAVITTTSGVLTTGTVPVASGGTGATTAATALTNLGLTATAAELNKMDGVTATTAELNYIDGVTSNIQTQLNAKAPLASPTFTGTVTGTFSGNITGNVTGNCSGTAGSISGYNNPTTAGTASTIAYRDGSGDIYARLFRSTYANQTTIGSGAAICYRTDTTDNYIRFCSDKAALRTYLNVPFVEETASCTTGNLTIYVNNSATGTGDGTSWANAFTTIQAAIDSLPAIINHDVTIYIRKGTSTYANTTIQRIVGDGSITIQGEFCVVGTVASAGSTTGKFNVQADDTGAATGDKVLMMKYSGTINNSTPTDAFIDTVASVSGTEITLTTRTTDTFTTSWTYLIVRTQTGNITSTNTENLIIAGLYTGQIYLNNNQNWRIIYTICVSSTTFPIYIMNSNNLNASSQALYQIGAMFSNTTAYEAIALHESSIFCWQICGFSSGPSNRAIFHQIGGYTQTRGAYLKGMSGGSPAGIQTQSNGFTYLTQVYIDGYNTTYKLAYGELASLGGIIQNFSSPTFGSNITTQKSPANWAATTDGSYIS